MEPGDEKAHEAPGEAHGFATRITIERHSGERRIARTATKRSALKERHSESAKFEAEDRSSGDRRARRARVDSPRGRAESSSVDRCSD